MQEPGALHAELDHLSDMLLHGCSVWVCGHIPLVGCQAHFYILKLLQPPVRRVFSTTTVQCKCRLEITTKQQLLMSYVQSSGAVAASRQASEPCLIFQIFAVPLY